MILENAIDAMNRISENIMVSKIAYRNVIKKKNNAYW